MDHSQSARRFWDDGCVIVRGVFPADAVGELDRELARYLRDVVPTLGGKDVFFENPPSTAIKSAFRLHERSDYFQRLMEDPRLLAILQALLPDGQVLPTLGVMYFAKAARDGSITPAHQDNGFQHWQPPLAVTLTIAVDRSTPDNGVLTCNRGSHRLGLLPHRQSGVLGFSRCLAEPIDVAIHSVETVHYSGANTSTSPRRQIGIGYRSSVAQRDEASHTRYLQELEAFMAAART
jgi:ectoine hydroxylase-related dioxygenase (phytanoyl-CoA dioxygenase family)